MVVPPDIDGLPPAELKQLVVKLLEENAEQRRVIAELRDEVARLKGLKGRPPIKPSGMENATAPKPGGKRARRRGRGKATPRVNVEEQILKAEVPAGSRFKGYEDFLVQDLELRVRVIRYRRERWVTPDGRTVIAPLPPGVRGHVGPELRRFVLAPQDSPHLSNRSENVCEERLLVQHLGEALHQWAQPVVTHGRDEVIEQAALAEQRMGTAFGGVGLEHPIITQGFAGGPQQGQQDDGECVDQP